MHLFCPDFKAILVHLLGILARVTTMAICQQHLLTTRQCHILVIVHLEILKIIEPAALEELQGIKLFLTL